MASEPSARARIADIIRDSGKLGAEQPSSSQSDLAAAVGALSNTPAGVLLASEAISDALAKRFHGLSASADIDCDLAAPYETSGRALVLALQACNH
ncbi:MAG: hypothetical protein WB615_00650, partial [Candidatus Tumulicola sp.]